MTFLDICRQALKDRARLLLERYDRLLLAALVDDDRASLGPTRELRNQIRNCSASMDSAETLQQLEAAIPKALLSD